MVSKEPGAFACSGFINHTLPRDVGYIRVGMRLKDQYWWAPSIEGIVVDFKMRKVGDSIAVVYVGSKALKIGDKLGTGSGLKFTIGDLLPYKATRGVMIGKVIPEREVPGIIEEKTGREFKLNLLIGTKNITR